MTTSPYPEEPPDHRTARHLHMCRVLAELGMGLAHNAAQAAQSEWAATPEPAQPAAEPTALRAQASETAPRTLTDTPRREPASPSLAFTRLSQCIRQTIALEIRIAADLAASTQRAATQAANRAFCAGAAAPRPAAQPYATPPHHTPASSRFDDQDTDPSPDTDLAGQAGFDSINPVPSILASHAPEPAAPPTG